MDREGVEVPEEEEQEGGEGLGPGGGGDTPLRWSVDDTSTV